MRSNFHPSKMRKCKFPLQNSGKIMMVSLVTCWMYYRNREF